MAATGDPPLVSSASGTMAARAVILSVLFIAAISSCFVQS
jgi:hypothetical protein